MTCGDSPHDLAVIKGPNAKLHHYAFHLEDWGAILRAGDVFSMDDVPIESGRPGTDHAGNDDLLLRPVGQPQGGVRRPGLPGPQGLPDDQLDGGPAREGDLLPRTRAQRRVHHGVHVGHRRRDIFEHRCRADQFAAAGGAHAAFSRSELDDRGVRDCWRAPGGDLLVIPFIRHGPLAVDDGAVLLAGAKSVQR